MAKTKKPAINAGFFMLKSNANYLAASATTSNGKSKTTSL